MSTAVQTSLLAGEVGVVEWQPVPLAWANQLLEGRHYLGPTRSGRICVGGVLDGELVAVQVWRHVSARNLPADGSWIELCRWCLTPAAGSNAGSRQHRASVAMLRAALPAATTMVSYSDPSAGHTGALYRACNWLWAPTWHRLRPPPSGLGSWDGIERQAVKDRWVFPLRRDPRRAAVLAVRDRAAARSYLAGDEWATLTHRWPCAVELEGGPS